MPADTSAVRYLPYMGPAPPAKAEVGAIWVNVEDSSVHVATNVDGNKYELPDGATLVLGEHEVQVDQLRRLYPQIQEWLQKEHPEELL
jgi:hypothetical protein